MDCINVSSSILKEDSNIETIQLLLNHGANINIQENEGWTVLMLLVKYNHGNSNIKSIKLLLKFD